MFKTVGFQEFTVHSSWVQRPALQRSDARVPGVVTGLCKGWPH